MRTSVFLLIVLAVAAFVSLTVRPTEAQLTPAQFQREYRAIQQEVSKSTAPIRRKNFDDAESILNEADSRLKKLTADAGLKDDVPLIANLQRAIEAQRGLVQRGRGAEAGTDGGDAVSFAKDVAPILNQRCANCHSNNPRGNLRLDTFAGMKRGGASGVLVQAGNSAGSLLIGRLTAPPAQRMPRNDPALPPKDIETIAAWINQGAKFDGDNENTPLARLSTSSAPAAPRVRPEDIVINKPTGNETVSFTRDVAPFMANICMNCHSGNNPRSGFSLETFEKLMIGGNSGRVVIPGNLDGSRLWDLAGKQDPIKMPPGQVLITRSNHANLRKWIEEGAKFDGPDPKASLRTLVPTDADIRAAELAKMSAEEFHEFRMKRSQELWEDALPRVRPRWVTGKEFVVFGNVAEPRLQVINQWADEHARSLRSLFNEKADPIWKGKLTVFVMDKRFDYEEFNQIIARRETPAGMTGHSVVTASYEDAYIVLEDVGDDVTYDSPGLKVNLIDHLTGAYLKRSGANLPNWVLRGTGLALAAKADSGNDYIKGLQDEVPGMLQSIERPEALFADGTFSPTGTAAVGYALVDFMLKNSTAKFGQFIRSLQGGSNVAAAMQSAYQTDLPTAARAFAGSLGSGRRAGR